MSRAKRVVSSLDPRRAAQRRLSRQVIMHFCEDNGFAYFGRVHQKDEELRVVYGMTLSQTHRDNHYAVGSIRGYDVTLIERTDTLRIPSRPAHSHQWLIFAFDLLTDKDLPHLFLGHNLYSAEFYEIIFTKFDRIQRATLGTFEDYDPEFLNNYSLFSKAAHALTGEQLFTKELTDMIMRHFGKLSVEIVGNRLYVYADHTRVTTKLLDTMLKNGLWLATSIDQVAEKLTSVNKKRTT